METREIKFNSHEIIYKTLLKLHDELGKDLFLNEISATIRSYLNKIQELERVVEQNPDTLENV
ncbi:MAG: hypothetical protein ACXABD_16625 [Candidatus Thorarchaeota archaeon]|jgi:hypothetical protein